MRIHAKALKRPMWRLGVPLALGLSVAGCSIDGTPSSAGLITNSTGPSSQSDLNQPLPQAFADNGAVQVADNARYVPQATVGDGAFDPLTTASVGNSNATIQQSTLPDLAPSVSMSKVSTPMANSNANTTALNTIEQPQQLTTRPRMISVPDDSIIHQVGKGESLYTIARRYDVAVETLYKANGMKSNDRLRVGQNLIVPGVSGSVVAQHNQVASIAPIVPKIAKKPRISAAQVAQFQREAQTEAPKVKPVQVAKAVAPKQTVLRKPEQVALPSKITNLRWPVQGQVTAPFKANNPGIKIDVPAGSIVRAAEGGEVIYVGSGIKGYGNLVLVRHSDGIVTVYAHLQDVMVKKGKRLNRGDALATVGMTGNVTRPMLHFEVRKDAKPVDPMGFLV